MLNPYHFHFFSTGNHHLPTLLLLHGFLGNGDDFTFVISQLSQYFNCLAVDLPGHGKTQVNGQDECYTLSKTAEGLIDWLKELKIQRCFLVGYSMGGRLALYLALYYSQYFHAVILESASPGLKTESERTQRYLSDLKLAENLEQQDLQDFLENWYNKPLFKTFKQHPDYQKILTRRLKSNPKELAKSLRGMGTGNQPSLWEKLSTIQIPLLLMVGESDQKFVRINQYIVDLCSTAKLEIIPDCGHNIHLESPQQWIKVVQEFCLFS
ncbi:MAG: 2-succinyl-6-hydroxy-2,4-cyclohexadiene-1-carboxylate synthase [Cyanobacteriota bacterium]|nr:2-succinyl-6-hydroxy-2,4-cyclohexadiene-1-carboxylate synthase [Cyanobacteriota bacterium]